MNVPKIRFSKYNYEWNYEPLNKYVERIIRKNKNKESDLVLTISAQYGLVDQCTFFNRNVSSSNLDGYYLLYKGDFAYNKSYSNGYPWGAVKRLNLYDKGVVSSLYICFNTNTLIDSDYLQHYFETNKWYSQISSISVEGARNHGLLNIAVNDFFNTEHFFPNIEEQKDIAKVLNLLDKKIELQTKKIEDLKLFKLSLREKLVYMFPTDNKKLSEILIKWNKKNMANKYSYVESVSNKFGFIAQNEQFEDRNIASNDTSNYYVIEKGVFAYNPSRLNVGSLALKQNDKISLVSPLYECFTTNQNQDFMLEWFQSKEFRRGTFSKYEGGVRNTLNFNNLSSIEINLPSIESQNKIVKVLSCYNKLIYLELAKLNKLRELKRGLMQQLFV